MRNKCPVIKVNCHQGQLFEKLIELSSATVSASFTEYPEIGKFMFECNW